MPTVLAETMGLLEARRTVANHELAEPGPSEADVRRMIAVAARVPDHGKLTPWRFVLYRGEARAALDARLAPLWDARFPDAPAEKARLEKTRFQRLPLTVGVISTAREHVKIPVWEQELSVGAACMNLMLAAHALGFSAQWLTGWCCYDPEAAAILGAKAGERFAGLICVGTPTVPPVDRPRPSFEAICSEWSA